MLVAGADGCPKGWVVVTAEADVALRWQAVVVVPGVRELLQATEACAAVAIDIPIGLSDCAPRGADRAARRVLGRPRGSSVFPPPLRQALYCEEYRAACDASVRAGGKRLSRQTFNILPKIREADDALTPALQARVCEAHPEVCFAMLNASRPMSHNKKTAAGRREREIALEGIYGEPVVHHIPPPGSARDDLYDAAVLAFTALRVANGRAARLPELPELDRRGLRMEIVY